MSRDRGMRRNSSKKNRGLSRGGGNTSQREELYQRARESKRAKVQKSARKSTKTTIERRKTARGRGETAFQ